MGNLTHSYSHFFDTIIWQKGLKLATLNTDDNLKPCPTLTLLWFAPNFLQTASPPCFTECAAFTHSLAWYPLPEENYSFELHRIWCSGTVTIEFSTWQLKWCWRWSFSCRHERIQHGTRMKNLKPKPLENVIIWILKNHHAIDGYKVKWRVHSTSKN